MMIFTLRRTLVLFAVVLFCHAPIRSEAQSTYDRESDKGGFHGWQIDGHIGVMPSPTTSGTSALPPSLGPTPQGFSRIVPSWYFGDGALLANEVAQAIVTAPPPKMTPLDPVLTNASAAWQRGADLGFRVGHSASRYALVEFALDRDQAHMALANDAVAAIEATRASFEGYFSSILARNTNATNISTNSTATVVNNTGHQILTTGDVAVNVGTFAGFTPYFTVGAGLLLPLGDL